MADNFTEPIAMMHNKKLRLDRDAKIDARLSGDLRRRLERIALVRDCQLSDLVRDALRDYADRREAQLTAA